MYEYYNSNPVANHVGDCSVRAVAKALGITWEQAFEKLAVNAFRMGDVISSNNVIASVLRMNGFYRENLPDAYPDHYTVRKFAEDNPVGTYVLGTGSHVVAVVDGRYFDTWDSGDEIPKYVWMR